MRFASMLLVLGSLGAIPASVYGQQGSGPASASASKQASALPASSANPPVDGAVLHAQVLLDAAGFSPGVIDGRAGMSLAKAFKGFQQARGLKVTGKLDQPTRQALLADKRPATIMVKLSPEQVSGPFVFPFPAKPEGQARLKFLGYRNMLEKVAEEFHTTPATIVALNGPQAMIGANKVLKLPNVVPANRTYDSYGKKDILPWLALLNVQGGGVKGERIEVSKAAGVLRVLDAQARLIAQFPVTTGSSHDPLPLGTWKVTTYAFLPPFNYQPDLFWDVSDDKAPQRLAPGPNGPVGLAWLDLTKEHYGIHGTGEPQTIGRAQSHGCVRMTNWDVLRLSQMLKPGFQAKFVP